MAPEHTNDLIYESESESQQSVLQQGQLSIPPQNFRGTSPTDQDRGPTKAQRHFKPTLLPDGIISPLRPV